MSNFEDDLRDEVAAYVKSSNDQVLQGQRVAAVLVDPTVKEFFAERTRDLVKLLMTLDTSDMEAIRAVVIGLRTVGALHNHLTQAVTAGLVAAQRLHEQANEGAKP